MRKQVVVLLPLVVALAACGDSDQSEIRTTDGNSNNGILNDGNSVAITKVNMSLFDLIGITDSNLNQNTVNDFNNGQNDLAADATTCIDGGSIDFQVTQDNSGLNIIYNDCSENGQNMNGVMKVEFISVSQTGYASNVIFEDFVFSSDGYVQEIDGSIQYNETINSTGASNKTNYNSLSMTMNNVNYVINDLEVIGSTQTSGNKTFTANGSITDDGDKLSITTNTTFETDNSQDYYVVGSMIIVADADGSSININADTGDEKTVAITTTDAGGSVSSDLLNWDNF